MNNSNQITTKRFIIRKSLIGTKTIVNVEFKSGKTAVYNHDDVYEVMKDKLNAMNCFAKYKSYTSSTSVPVIARHLVK